MLGWRAVPSSTARVRLASKKRSYENGRSLCWLVFMRLHKAFYNRLYQSTIQRKPAHHCSLPSSKKDPINTSISPAPRISSTYIYTDISPQSTTKSSYSYNSHYYYYSFLCRPKCMYDKLGGCFIKSIKSKALERFHGYLCHFSFFFLLLEGLGGGRELSITDRRDSY